MKTACTTRLSYLKRARAFTLIELLLGIAIMATIVVAINAVFFTAMRLRERATELVDRSLPIQQALGTMRRDLQGAMAPSGLISGTFRSGDVAAPGVALPVEIEFNTTTGVLRDSEPWGEVQRVSYGLRMPQDRTAAGNDLYRYVTRNLLADIIPQPEEHWMMSGVEDLQISCYDGLEWRDYWDTSLSDTNLPSAVRVRILLANRTGGEPGQMEMIVPIWSQSRTNATTEGMLVE